MFGMLVDAGPRERLLPALGVSNLGYCIYKIRPLSPDMNTRTVAHRADRRTPHSLAQAYGS